MAKRNPGRAGRSRKRRPAGRSTPAPQATPSAEQPPAKSARRAREREPATSSYKAPMSVGERPQAPWHPLPLSELLILVGGIGTVIALGRGEVKTGGAALFASLGAVAIGTIEVTLREHLSGYRSHTMILALLPTIVFHSVVVLTLAAFLQLPRLATTGMLVLDGALFAFLFKLLRARFLDARRERVFAGRG
ncbi:MAG TPA: hypothetical protein VNR42_01625 [Solirubrobacteraceae bacterium]|nr:hypothetical protein [Solirubrobacteraceae bacterium]